MKALGKRKSNKEGTLLPVLSGGMSRAAVNKCVSNSERKREGEGKEETERNNGAEHGTLSLGPADDYPREYVLTRRKLLNARGHRHSSTSKSVSPRCLSVAALSASASEWDQSIRLLIGVPRGIFRKVQTGRKHRTHQDSALLRDYDTI